MKEDEVRLMKEIPMARYIELREAEKQRDMLLTWVRELQDKVDSYFGKEVV